MNTFETPPARRQVGQRGALTGAPETLRDLYLLYCQHEARELVQILPSDARRQLLRRLSSSGEPSIPRLIDLAATLLPLPPYDVWVASYLGAREPYLQRLGVSRTPERTDPVTVAIRPVAGKWWAHLNLRQNDRLWLGFISFHPEVGLAAEEGPQVGLVLRTADIFRGEDADEMRARFLAFGEATLQGFLRSVTP